jgi:4-diphosphocytidyl-2-C-methyl-D-erythritol kinase
MSIAPVISEVLAALDGAALARMSGSGATCFGLFASSEAAHDAQARIASAHPDWWVKAAKTL